MSDLDFAISYLKAIEKTHINYFVDNDLKIMDCVIITGDRLVRVQITNKELPLNIRHEIETMFWIV